MDNRSCRYWFAGVSSAMHDEPLLIKEPRDGADNWSGAVQASIIRNRHFSAVLRSVFGLVAVFLL
jgi:hypothetical protein